MWLRLVLLSLYLLLLFLLSRLLEVAVWCSHGEHLLFMPRITLDPFALSVGKLRQLLDNRGISYTGVIEKNELTTLVEASGQITKQELAECERSTSHQTVHFTGGSHFYEEVEDTKDSVWLVQVLPADQKTPSSPEEAASWKQVVAQVGKFGVRTGVFECAKDRKLCRSKGWISSRLLLALPRGQHAKEDMVLHSYYHTSKPQAVLQWVRQHLSSRIPYILPPDADKWLKLNDSQLKVLLISHMKDPPMFLSALAIKFTGRYKFGMMKMRPGLRKKLNDLEIKEKQPLYLIVTPGSLHTYGSNVGEVLNFKRMELFLKSLRPEMNDVFLVSLFLMNLAIGLELFLVNGKLWKHCIRWFLQLIKCNCLLFLFWVLLLGIYQFPFMNSLTHASLKCLRFVSETQLGTILRNDSQHLYSSTFFTVTFCIFGFALSALWKLSGRSTDQDIALFSDWWSMPWDSYVMNYFFRPMATLTRPMVPQDLDLEEGMELLIERLAVPNLWLQPIINSDYLKDLPIWNYCGWHETDDETYLDSLNRSSSQSSDEDRSYIPKTCVCPNSAYLALQERYDNSPAKAAACKPLAPTNSASNKGPNSKQGTNAKRCLFCLKNTQSHRHQSASYQQSNPNGHQRSPPGMLEFRECSICLESYYYAEILCGLPCGHNYHFNCIMLWLSRDNHCCPVCRWPPYKPNQKTSSHLHSQ